MKGFEAAERSLRPNELVLFILFGEKGPFTNRIGKFVKQLVDVLETEI
jgi:hypothetical protein